jgi:multidrug resistance efflux pump
MPNQTIPATEANRRRIGRGISFAIILASVVVAVIAVWAYDYRPQTDDATIRANFIGIAPHASGHIVELHVKDNQFVKEGDLLFVMARSANRLANQPDIPWQKTS